MLTAQGALKGREGVEAFTLRHSHCFQGEPRLPSSRQLRERQFARVVECRVICWTH
jgi:hypothetical protein